MGFDQSSPRLVLAGTVYGECSGGGRIGMENVAAVVLQRLKNDWARTLVAVCLAPAQFTCWSDRNLQRIETAAQADPASWSLALAVADETLGGSLPVRTCGADSYFARSLHPLPYWAAAPARQVYCDRWHAFWLVRAMQDGPRPAPSLAAAGPLAGVPVWSGSVA